MRQNARFSLATKIKQNFRENVFVSSPVQRLNRFMCSSIVIVIIYCTLYSCIYKYYKYQCIIIMFKETVRYMSPQVAAGCIHTKQLENRISELRDPRHYPRQGNTDGGAKKMKFIEWCMAWRNFFINIFAYTTSEKVSVAAEKY